MYTLSKSLNVHERSENRNTLVKALNDRGTFTMAQGFFVHALVFNPNSFMHYLCNMRDVFGWVDVKNDGIEDGTRMYHMVIEL